jgi:hypothetical protein
MPRAAGQVKLEAIGTSAGEQLTGELVDLVFQEVTISENYETQIVTDGALLNFDMWSFDVTLGALNGASEECGGHGQIHGDHCHCDSGYRLDPEDSTQCIAE